MYAIEDFAPSRSHALQRPQKQNSLYRLDNQVTLNQLGVQEEGDGQRLAGNRGLRPHKK